MGKKVCEGRSLQDYWCYRNTKNYSNLKISNKKMSEASYDSELLYKHFIKTLPPWLSGRGAETDNAFIP